MPFQFYCPQGHLLEGHESQAGQQSQCPLCGAVFVMPGGAMAGAPVQQPGWPGYPPGYPQQPMPGYGQSAPGYGQPGYAPQSVPGYPTYPGAYPGYPQGYAGAPGQPVGAPAGYGPGPVDPAAGQFGPQAAPAFGGYGGPATSEGFPVVNPDPGLPVVKTGEEHAAAAPPSEPATPAAPKAEEEKKEPRIVRIPCPQGHELQTPADMFNQEVLCPICSTQFHLRYEDSIEFKEEQAELRRRKAEQLNQAVLKWSIIAAAVIVLSIVGMVIYLAVRSPGEATYGPQERAIEQAPTDTPPAGEADTTPAANSGGDDTVAE